jgi:hypothetical protein
MFGKRFAEYVRFEKWILAFIAMVFALRLVMSLAGLPNGQTRWVSMNIALLAGMICAAVAVHRSGFGSYKQLLVSLFCQVALAHFLIAMAIILGIALGRDNIFTAPEFFGGRDGKNWLHAFLHVVVAPLIFPLVLWLPGSLILLITRKLTPRTR